MLHWCVRLAVTTAVSMGPITYSANGQVDPPVAEDRTAISETLDLAMLVDLAAARLGIAIEYDAANLKAEVTVRGIGSLSDAALWDLANQLLATRDLTTVRVSRQDTLSVVPISTAASIARIEHIIELGSILTDVASPRAGFELLLIRPRHRAAVELALEVAGVANDRGASVKATQGSQIITVSGFSSRVDVIVDLLTTLDVLGEATTVASIIPQHLRAETLAVAVAQVADKQALISGNPIPGEVIAAPDGRSLLIIAPKSMRSYWVDLIERLDHRDAVETRTYIPRHHPIEDVGDLIQSTIGAGDAPSFMADDRFRIVPDELTESLIVTATAAQHDRIVELMARLDQVPPESRRVVRHFGVQNRSATELLGVLSGLIEGGALGVASMSGLDTSTRQSASDGTSDVSSMDVRRSQSMGSAATAPLDAGSDPSSTRPPIIVGDSLSLTLDPTTNTLIAIGAPRVLDQLETLIESLDVRQPQVRLEVVMVSLSDSDSLDFAVQLEKLFDLENGTTLKLMSLFGLSPITGDIGLGGGGSGFTGTVLSPGEFSGVVRALETINEGRALSRPYMLVGNNRQATFDAVIEEPFVSVNAANTIATTSFGGAVPAGTVVTVTPTITSGDHLELEYSVSLSSFVGESTDPAIPPPRQESKITSVSTIPDGYTVVVGGIEALTEGESISRVPFLGSLPIVGELFTSRSTSHSRSRFYVFIRADIMRGDGFEFLKYASDLASREVGLDDGWPTVEPRIIR